MWFWKHLPYAIGGYLGAWGVMHLLGGLSKIITYKTEIEAAFQRDPRPFKPNQLWLVKAMLCLFWHKIDWNDEVHYYKDGKPEWMLRRDRSSGSDSSGGGNACPSGIRNDGEVDGSGVPGRLQGTTILDQGSWARRYPDSSMERLTLVEMRDIYHRWVERGFPDSGGQDRAGQQDQVPPPAREAEREDPTE